MHSTGNGGGGLGPGPRTLPRKTANIALEVDEALKARVTTVLESRGMTLSGTVRRMVAVGVEEHRIPFEVTRGPVYAGVGMSDAACERYGIDRSTPPRNGEAVGLVVKMTLEMKAEMREWCRDMCITPNAIVSLLLGQIAFELRVPFGD